VEFYVRILAKNGVRLVSITQEIGDPMHVMIRQIMARRTPGKVFGTAPCRQLVIAW
jgi:hypothetical protein